MKKYLFPVLALMAASFTACENDDQAFPNYEGGVTVYYAYQYPVRTIELGEDNEINTDLDNEHKFQIVSTYGGAYKGQNIQIQIAVDNALCNNLYFEDGSPVQPMPTSYYTINTNVDYAGTPYGKAEVQLNDAFFNDPASIGKAYVIPVVIANVPNGINTISGTPLIEGTSPSRTDAKMWDPVPMDYTLYCVRYVNPWNGTYLVKQGDKEIDKSTPTVPVKTMSMTQCSYTNVDGITMTLTFSGNNCTISGDGISGSGEFKQKSEIKAWGNKDRDALYLKYTANGKSYDETLVVQRRTTDGDAFNTIQEFSPVYK